MDLKGVDKAAVSGTSLIEFVFIDVDIYISVQDEVAQLMGQTLTPEQDQAALAELESLEDATIQQEVDEQLPSVPQVFPHLISCALFIWSCTNCITSLMPIACKSA